MEKRKAKRLESHTKQGPGTGQFKPQINSKSEKMIKDKMPANQSRIDYLISKGKEYELKKNQAINEKEGQELKGITFQPNLFDDSETPVLSRKNDPRGAKKCDQLYQKAGEKKKANEDANLVSELSSYQNKLRSGEPSTYSANKYKAKRTTREVYEQESAMQEQVNIDTNGVNFGFEKKVIIELKIADENLKISLSQDSDLDQIVN